MRIGISGYVGTHLTGIGRVLVCVLKEMARLFPEDEYVVFANSGYTFYDALATLPNVKVVDTGVSKDSPLANIIWHQWGFQRSLRQWKCDLAYIPNFSLLLWKQIPTVVTIHDLIEFNVPGKFSRLRMAYRKVIDPLMVRNSTSITTVSECSKRDIIRFCNAKEEKVRVIHNAVDTTIFHEYDKEDVIPVIEKYGLNYKSYFIFVGTIDYPGKNIKTVIEAFFQLKTQQPNDHQLVIVGKDGHNAQVIYDLVNGSAYKKDVLFTGYVPDADLPILYSGAKVMLYLSFYEGFGLPVLEAMSCATPVICSDTSCFPEVAGQADVCVCPTDVEAVADKLMRLTSDDNFCLHVTNQCRKQAKSFSWERSAKAYHEVFKRALDFRH